MLLAALAGLLMASGAAELPAWTFDKDVQGWEPNAHLANVAVKDGVLCADAIEWDPFFSMKELSIETKPWQYVLITMKASQDGEAELFWTGETTGTYGGFTQEKTVRFPVTGNGAMQEYVLFPFWQTEGTIRQLRFDLYNGTHFEIKSIQILSWGNDAPPQTSIYAWTFNGDVAPWRVHPKANELWSPPLNLAVKDKGWVSVALKADVDGTGSIVWSTADVRGMQTADFVIEAHPDVRTYNIEMQGLPEWRDGVAALGIRVPKEGVSLQSVAVGDSPAGPSELKIAYLGFADALNRTGAPCRIIADVANQGASRSDALTARLIISPDLRFASACAPAQSLKSLEYGETDTLVWSVSTQLPGDHKVFLTLGTSKTHEAALHFTKALYRNKADAVPMPIPVRSDIDVCAYYFPGWDSDAKWDCIRRIAPNRKPALGYYDESNPTCVDWQIKWAVENSISCFLVDWYWVGGAQSLTHWFEAYRKAKYRDLLKVAIMWANHNPPGTHSPEDWRNVTQEWIGRYFNLPAYYRIDGKPAVFIWAPSNVRNDLKGSEAVKKSMGESQEMARQAGYAGITFVAMAGDDFAHSTIQTLLQEGYSGITTYHEWGPEAAHAQSTKRMNYANVAKSVPKAWARKNEAAGSLTYYPVVDTGWDSRPWHGDKAFVIEGRTPPLFEHLLESAMTFAQEKGKKMIVLGPMNEWGEGSYIEPCVEFGFDMLEPIRRVFGVGSPKQWPVNAGPRDLGLGPYDYPERPKVSAWDFNSPDPGWKPLMGVADFACSDGCLRFKTTTGDPALVAETQGIRAAGFSKASVTMQITGPLEPGAQAQLFWSADAAATSETTSVHVPLELDGQMHTYTLEVAANKRWRGVITSLRFDPCNAKDVQVALDAFQLKP